MKRFTNFVKGVITEMKLTTWPTAKENRHDTTTVIMTSLMFAIFFGIVGWVITFLLEHFILK
ncbi:hypothetical protein FC83_GL000401 [Agrilactobacillus composti DSM 18527 = JCM 14202]|jgi:preprotein translocase subunit SecE|uniref:Protein translocase subunit SecE n=1 Tax=Agrilactobacillus composti DSM 18527 = JCM 14202 TaxID=1423734 RepID=X0PQV8_9LACO|nr:preprotein translocase subunit SecE [Agrilactobacillus composti]KRM32534.1 hypothetical protein FC83_GL000401 [Agrilactobacillus composti DSM 18527 = JCM 14202]MCH4172123.1 preprotein translocase subunit SecE [Lactobacillus sp.]GAF40162.1 preprotein translocase subunit SecE [Agrilactobacillus composti DSM 18527 = JCM 14202]